MAKFSSLSLSLSLARLLLSATGVLGSLTVDVNDAASVKKAAALVAEDLMSFYTGEIPGILPGPPPDGDYYWWTGGALWAAMLDYRSRTGDTQYDAKISEALLWQRGPNNDFLSPNWTASVGNDDQAIWAAAALLAAETGFAEPGVDDLKWVTLAQNVFDEETDRRIQNGSCAGGLRWQLFAVNSGYNYVSTTANVAYASLGARLGLQDRDDKTRSDSVKETFDWLQSSKLIDGKFNVFDGAHVPDCDQINKVQFSYTSALALEGAAAMYNKTGDAEWKDLVDGLAQRTIAVFFPDGVAMEVACEPDRCNTDMTFFKSFLHRSLASTMVVAPHTADLILPVLKTSAAAAAKSCTAGANERMCDYIWTGSSEGHIGAGPQMSVLSALLSLLPAEKVVATPGSGTNSTGTGSPSSSQTSGSAGNSDVPPSSGARAGLSSVVLLGSLLLAGFALN
ncbi:putative glycoside hydrolase family 76 protein [Rosellinia necatrix]|uniref:Mannan endo-1,6-alpha-mannosidase n=1 Tax=Rosellinia necatrix TaxID=77044 RepID=A0A1W2THH8_ROSNE|nr:putative glycoside hydrolase family 76 protein [Rosellinia necatrix]